MIQFLLKRQSYFLHDFYEFELNFNNLCLLPKQYSESFPKHAYHDCGCNFVKYAQQKRLLYE